MIKSLIKPMLRTLISGVVSGKINPYTDVTCTGATSLIEINQDNTGFVPLSGGEIIAGVIPAESSFLTEELGSKDAKTQIRFTGAGTVSYSRIVI
tara:strand:+ start:164 stop:448 length:285 start_codon:yes stop_codon:yes gene_type:complete